MGKCGEVKDPRRTLKVAAPIAVGSVTLIFLTNVAYFAAISKEDSEVIIVGLFFRNVFDDGATARALPGSGFVALINLGNVLVDSFSHACLNQEFGKKAFSLPAVSGSP